MNPLFKLSQKYIPSGVNSPVRAFGAVGGDPVFIKRGRGPWVWDESGKKYLDFCASWGPLLFGHSPEKMLAVLKREMMKGTSFGTATRKEAELAGKICGLYPSIEKVRLVNSGTEAVMSAIRLARGFTGRKKIVKIAGGYHGHVDSLLVQAGSGVTTFGIPGSAGIPEELARLTLTVPFNDPEALGEVFRGEGGEIAALILEPVPANMGVVLPEAGYLEKAREITKRYGALLIFDEVITGFRAAPGGAQEAYGVKPDLTTLGKILGGGFPIAAFGGRRDIMDHLAPAGPVYQAGTLSGNPVAVTAALWVMDQFTPYFPGSNGKKVRGWFDGHNRRSAQFFEGLEERINTMRLPVHLNSTASMFTLFFSQNPVTDYESAKASDTAAYARFFNTCRRQGLYLAPSQFEANFVSTAHSEAQLKKAAGILTRAIRSAVRKQETAIPLNA